MPHTSGQNTLFIRVFVMALWLVTGTVTVFCQESEVKITGEIDASTLFDLGDSDSILSLDLSGAKIKAYNGKTLRGESRYEADAIPKGAFAGSRIRSIKFPEGIKKFGDCAFQNSALNSVVIPQSVIETGEGAFHGCDSLVSAEVLCPNIGKRMFATCSNLREVKFGPALREIGERAFFGTDIRKLPLTDCESLEIIGKEAFAGCKRLVTIEFPGDKGIRLKSGAFMLAPLLAEIKNAEIKDYPSLAFACDSALCLEKVVGQATESIGDYSLWNLKSDGNLIIPSTLSNVGARSMAYVKGLTSIDASALPQVPETGEDVWMGIDRSKIELTVRPENISAFSSAPQWRDFIIKALSNHNIPVAEALPTARIESSWLLIRGIPAGTDLISLTSLSGQNIGSWQPVTEQTDSLNTKVSVSEGQIYILSFLSKHNGRKLYSIKLISH